MKGIIILIGWCALPVVVKCSQKQGSANLNSLYIMLATLLNKTVTHTIAINAQVCKKHHNYWAYNSLSME